MKTHVEQYVDKPTHISGHTQDLMITRCSDTLIGTKLQPDYLFSDDFMVTCDLILGRPAPSVKQVFYRKIKGIDEGKFKEYILRYDLFENCPRTLDDLIINLWLMGLINMLPCAKRSSTRGH